MIERPDPNNNIMIARFMNEYNVDEEEARRSIRLMQIGFDLGEEKGRADAQRFFRLALGVEVPEAHELALWNNPVPLKQPKEEEDNDG